MIIGPAFYYIQHVQRSVLLLYTQKKSDRIIGICLKIGRGPPHGPKNRTQRDRPHDIHNMTLKNLIPNIIP